MCMAQFNFPIKCFCFGLTRPWTEPIQVVFSGCWSFHQNNFPWIVERKSALFFRTKQFDFCLSGHRKSQTTWGPMLCNFFLPHFLAAIIFVKLGNSIALIVAMWCKANARNECSHVQKANRSWPTQKSRNSEMLLGQHICGLNLDSFKWKINCWSRI